LFFQLGNSFLRIANEVHGEGSLSFHSVYLNDSEQEISWLSVRMRTLFDLVERILHLYVC
jgi:hypothetical protein